MVWVALDPNSVVLGGFDFINFLAFLKKSKGHFGLLGLMLMEELVWPTGKDIRFLPPCCEVLDLFLTWNFLYGRSIKSDLNIVLQICILDFIL